MRHCSPKGENDVISQYKHLHLLVCTFNNEKIERDEEKISIIEMTRSEDNVRVVVRCRPLSSKEKSQGHVKIIDIDSKTCAGHWWLHFYIM